MNPISTARWRALIGQAEAAANCVTSEQLQSYLIDLLTLFSANPLMRVKVLRIENSLAPLAQARPHAGQLKEIGDHCLLFSGLFSHHAERRMLKLSHFVDIGQAAYQRAHEATPPECGRLYANLAREFITLMDLLHVIRELRDSRKRMTPLYAFELWNDTGSRHALRVIHTCTDAFPVRCVPSLDTLIM